MKNILNLIESKTKYRTPLGIKLLLGMKLSSEDLKVDGNLNLYNTKITSLPKGLKVGGDLDLYNTKITSLPKGLKVGGGLWLTNTKITSLPNDLKVGGDLDLRNTPLSKKYSKEQIRRMVPLVEGIVCV